LRMEDEERKRWQALLLVFFEETMGGEDPVPQGEIEVLLGSYRPRRSAR
jgi:hypothetical protein